MNRLTIISIFLMALATSCQKQMVYDESSRPILFSPPLTGTSRGTSLNSLDGKTFGVRAFVYDTQWESEKSEVLPHPKWVDIPVQCSTGGHCSYSPVQDWLHNKNYAFMAYYPLASESQGTITLPKANQIRGHVMTYTLHKDAHRDMNRMYDVMYAHSADLNEANTSRVAFTFRHALFGLQLAIDNLNNYPEAEPKKYVTINSLSMQLDILYGKVDIPLDGGPIVPYKMDDPKRKFEYKYITQAVKIPSTLNKSYYDILPGNHLLLIPQKGLTGSIKIKYNNEPVKTLDINFGDAELKAGVRYVITLQFLGDQINAILVNAGNWSDVQTDIDFE